jgi:GNAT superfamily N-acetyltransferase
MYTILDTEDDYRIEAISDDGKCIGYFEFAEDEPLPYIEPQLKLIYMHVDEDQKRKGIGTALMKHAVEKYDHFVLPARYLGSSELRPDIYLTEDEGIRFIDSCFNKGILPKDRFVDERDQEKPEEDHWN